MLGLKAVSSRTYTDGLWAGIPPHAPRTPMHCSSEPTLPWALAAQCPQAQLSSPFPSYELGRTDCCWLDWASLWAGARSAPVGSAQAEHGVADLPGCSICNFIPRVRGASEVCVGFITGKREQGEGHRGEEMREGGPSWTQCG